MLSKLSVLKASRISVIPVRRCGGLNLLQKYERLRALCCTSDSARRKAEVEDKLRPKPSECKPSKSCDGCQEIAELLPLEGTTAIVAGGASGIGFETADNLLKEGTCKVIIADIDQTKAMAAMKKLCAAYGDGKACFSLMDIRQLSSIEATFKEAYGRFNSVDVFVNCVGTYNETPHTWEQMVFTNLMGCVRGTLTAYNFMSKNKADSVIVNMSSYGAIGEVPSMPLFSAVANGINGLTTSFGQDFHFAKSKIRFVTVCPAGTDSDLLRYMTKFHYDKTWVSHSMQAIKYCTKQSPKVVGKAIVNAVRFGNNGCIYVVKEGKYYWYAMPDYMKIMRQEACLW